MSLMPRVLAAGGLLAVPALLAVGSQALSRPAEVPPVKPQTVVVDLAPPAEAGTGVEDGGNAGPPGSRPSTDQSATPSSPPPASGEPTAPPSAPAPAPAAPAPAPAVPGLPPAPATPVAPIAPVDQGTPGLVERQVLGDDGDDGADDGGVEFDDDAGTIGED